MKYLVDVRPLLKEIGGSMSFDGSVDIPVLEVGDETFTPVQPATFSSTIVNAGDGIVATGSVTLTALATCARCLCEFRTDIVGEIEGFWVEPDQERGDEGDTDLIDDDGAIDLWPVLFAALVIEAPYAPLHDQRCAGLCAQCGVDLNTESCSCDEVPDDRHPFAALRDVVVVADSEKSPNAGSDDRNE